MAIKLTATERAGLIELVEHSFSHAKTFQFQLRTYMTHKKVGSPEHEIQPMFKILYMKIGRGGKWETFQTKESKKLQKILDEVPWAAIEEIEVEEEIDMDILGSDTNNDSGDNCEDLL